MSNLILQGITVDQLLSELDSIIQKRVNEALVNQVSEKWLSVDEARNLWKPAISRNTLTKWSELYRFRTQRFGGTIKYLQSDILNQSKKLNQYHKP